ncbi:uncharacterized protein LOC143553298 [Bidens hawaiensis]|uniref:uncharacterized protein LOC143553298 n=1 Tax=Bidens hawaiensis TaxID=980011 RepID=UPI0040495CAC
MLDEGDWLYSSEWWDDNDTSNTVFRSLSDKGNGVVSVVASHSSRPSQSDWHQTEDVLRQRYAELHGLHPNTFKNGLFRILGYQWRTLRFNDDTRQSTAKVMAAYHESDPGSIFLMQQPSCLAAPYLRSMISAGLTSLSCNCDMLSSVYGKTCMKILCIGHGGGSLPLFLARKVPGAIIDIVEVDPVVIAASTQAMGFPSYSIMKKHGVRSHSKPSLIDQVLWNGIHERLFLHESDAQQFITESTSIYDMVFVDAYDGDDVFPRPLWDPDSVFLKALGDRVHPDHGTVVVNLHSDNDIEGESLLPMGKYVSQVCKAYKKVLLDDFVSVSGFAFTVQAPWVCNTSLVVSRGFRNSTRDTVKQALMSKSIQFGDTMSFSFLQYITRGLTFVD